MFCVQPETDHSTLINIMYSVGSLSNRIKNECTILERPNFGSHVMIRYPGFSMGGR